MTLLAPPRGASARWLGVAFGVLLWPAASGAQSVDEIVAKYTAARGGQRIASLQSLRMTTKARSGGGREAVIVREQKRHPDRLRLEFTSQGVTGVYAYDGARGWRISPFDGEFAPTPMSAPSAELALDQSDIGGPLLDWRAKGHRVELAGRESIDGKGAWKLQLTLKNGERQDVYLDASSYLQVRTESKRMVRGRELTLQTDFADYRETGGARFPHTIEIRVKRRPARLRIEVQTVELDPALDDARFRMPDAR